MLIGTNAKGRGVGRGEESVQLKEGDGWDWRRIGDGTFMGLQCKPEVGPPYLHTVGPIPRDIIKYSQFFRRTKLI